MTDTPSHRRSWLPVLLAGLCLIAVIGGRYALQANTLPLHDDPDDAMRMVTAMDLLGGQPWQDLSVARDNTPFGGRMHWSRLVDAPIAGLIALLGPNAAAICWPLLLLLPLLAATWLVVNRLVPTAGLVTVAALTALNLATNTEFVPGRVDHHNVQIVLIEVLLACLVLGRQRFGGGLLAGLAAATCLAIGLEPMVIVIAACAAVALCWIVDPVGHRSGVFGVAAGLGGGALVHLAIAAPPSHWFVPACDMLSIVYVTGAALGAIALSFSALVASSFAIGGRVAVIGVLGVAAATTTLALFPQCLAGPYAGVDPGVLARLFPTIDEARPLWQALVQWPWTIAAMAGPVLLGFAITARRAIRTRGSARLDWTVVLLLLAGACVLMALQLRGGRLAAMLAVPAAAWMVAEVRTTLRPGVRQAAAMLATWLVFATPLTLSLAAILDSRSAPGGSPAVARTAAISDCRKESAFAELALLPAGRIAAPIAIAAHILRYTPHSVLSAGFHRNGQSILDSLDFFAGDEVRAWQIAAERGLTYVVTCGADPVIAGRSWLEPLASAGPLQLYRIAQ